MRTILILLFAVSLGTAAAQPSEKGNELNSMFTLKVYDSSGVIPTMYDTIVIYMSSWLHVEYPDTVYYELTDQDSAVARFYLIDEVSFPGGYDASWPMEEELIYGEPVYDDQGYAGYTATGIFYRRTWAFTDSALFKFTLRFGGMNTHYVKLTKKASPATPPIEDIPEPQTLAVYPNPAGNDMYIRLPADFSAKLSLTDASGRVVKTWDRVGPHQIDISGYASGSYMLQITGDGKNTIFRVQKD